MALHPGAPGTVADAPLVSSAADLSKKVRKPYTITKSRESWTEQEHDKFLEALQLFDRDWKKIEAFVGTKTVIQIRSHAQKYFLKVQKNGTGEHVPPPRPKRKSAQPYPQKAAKIVPAAQQVATSITEPGYPMARQTGAVTPVSSASAMPAWVHHMAAPSSVGFVTKGLPAMGSGPMGAAPSKDPICIKSESSSIPSQQLPGMSQGSADIVLRAMPDFGEVYSFLGSVFDPAANGHLEKMREMAPIDRETVLLLMRNLSINLSSSDFEEHKLFLSVYDMESEDALRGTENDVRSHLEAPDFAAQRPLDGGDGPPVSGYSELCEVSDGEGVTGDVDAGKLNRALQACPDDTSELPLQCYPDEVELASSREKLSRPLNGDEPCVPLTETPLFLGHLDEGHAVRLTSEADDSELRQTGNSFEATELDDGKVGAEIVDMWWS